MFSVKIYKNTHSWWSIVSRRRMISSRPGLVIASADWLSAVEIRGGDSRKPRSTSNSNSPTRNPGVIGFFDRSLLKGGQWMAAALWRPTLGALADENPFAPSARNIAQRRSRPALTPTSHTRLPTRHNEPITKGGFEELTPTAAAVVWSVASVSYYNLLVHVVFLSGIVDNHGVESPCS